MGDGDEEFFHKYIVVDRFDRETRYVWRAWFKGQRSYRETIGDSQFEAVGNLVRGLRDWEYWTICRKDEVEGVD